jgi:plasmid stabilization system protein ParE
VQYEIHPEAQSEVDDTVRYLSRFPRRRGIEFVAEYKKALAQIKADPRRYPPDEDASGGHEVRYYLLPKYKHRLVFLVLADRLVVIAVANFSRPSDYWLNRFPTT